jgi:hypothetical protein
MSISPFNIYGIFQSGKSLLYDLIPDSCIKLPRELDIEIYRRSDGLIDFYDKILISPDPTSHIIALRRLLRLFSSVALISRNNPFALLARPYIIEHFNYESCLPGFNAASSSFFCHLGTDSPWTAHNLLSPFSETSLQSVLRRLMRKLNIQLSSDVNVYINPATALSAIRNFSREILASFHDSPRQNNALILNNLCYPGQETRLLKIFPEITNICIIRDPTLCFTDLFYRSNADAYFKSSIGSALPLHSIKQSMEIYSHSLSLLHEQERAGACTVIRFEDLICHPKEVIDRLQGVNLFIDITDDVLATLADSYHRHQTMLKTRDDLFASLKPTFMPFYPYYNPL